MTSRTERTVGSSLTISQKLRMVLEPYQDLLSG